MTNLPAAVAELVDELSSTSGVVAVTLGGSRALGTNAKASDWDLGVYYRGSLDLTRLAARGTVYPPGSWGRLMNGGAWLRVGGERVDVLFRDLDAVEHWTRKAEQGQFEVDSLLGYLAGVPTYLLAAELASCRTLTGTLPESPFPPRLAAQAPPIWRFCRSFSLSYARVLADRGNRVAAIGQTAKAVFEEAHAVLSERSVWTCNEKRMLDEAELGSVHEMFAHCPSEASDLVRWIDVVGERLGASPNDAAPWNGA